MMIDRLLKFIDLKGLNKNQFYKKTGLSNGFLDKVKDVGSSKLERILNTFPDLNLEWLITGRGNMLKSDTGSPPEDCDDLKDEIIKLQRKIIRLQDDRQTFKKQDDEPDSMGQEKLKHNN